MKNTGISSIVTTLVGCYLPPSSTSWPYIHSLLVQKAV